MSALALVLLKLGMVVAPLFVLAAWPRVYPTGRLILAALVPSLLTLGLLGVEGLRWVILSLDIALGIVLLADALTLPARKAFAVRRETLHIASLGKPHAIVLWLSNLTGKSRQVELRDDVSEQLAPKPDRFEIVAEPRSRTELAYQLCPTRRGMYELEGTDLRVRSRLGLWTRLLHYDCPTRLNVYHDMKQLAEYAVLARTNRLSLVGMRRSRKTGRDHDFERLRDFTVDDNYRYIDWRATARRRKLTVKEFQASQSQRIVFLVDCGRMMTNEAAGLTLLDHALNAMLMLSFVALHRNDSVGLICFSDRIHSYVPVRSGRAQMNRLLHASFDQFPERVESRYDQAFEYLGTHARKRSLVVLMTNIIDEINAHQVQRYLTNLVGRHLPLGVLLRDRQLFNAVELEHPRGDALWRAAAAADILGWRHQLLTDLSGKGALSLDVYPEEMTAPLVNRYLEIKARHLL